MSLDCQIQLRRDGVHLASYPLTPFGLTLGSAPGCSVRVPDEGCPLVALLIRPHGGTVTVSRITDGTTVSRDKHLPYDQTLPLWGPYTVTRTAITRTQQSHEPPIPAGPIAAHPLHISVGSPSSERRRKVTRRGLLVGSSEGCDLKLSDRHVAKEHCWLARAPSGVVVRDLGSHTGVWANGVRVHSAVVARGGVLRIGRTNLYIGASERPAPPLGTADDVVVRSASLTQVQQLARRYACLPWPALVVGESGVGKEAVAGWLHHTGDRAQRPFVKVNAGGLSDSLMDSELFGYQRGAFTGAERDHIGFFEQAGDGTLFLDEVGELSPKAQVRLLRVLETQRVRRVGAEREISVAARVVCATHRDLELMVSKGHFRADLYYRLSQLVLRVPPIRQRPEDLDGLIDHFLRQATRHVGARSISKAARTKLRAAPWPGNARELRNVILSAAASCPSAIVDVPDVAPLLRRAEGSASDASPVATTVHRIRTRLNANGGNVARTARDLGIPRSTLRDRLRRSVP